MIFILSLVIAFLFNQVYSDFINCTSDHYDSRCDNDPVECQGLIYGQCNIQCGGHQHICGDKKFHCFNGSECELHCTSSLACSKVHIKCPDFAECRVYCTDHQSCEDMTVISGNQSEIYFTADGDFPLRNVHIIAPNASSVDVKLYDGVDFVDAVIDCGEDEQIHCEINAMNDSTIGGNTEIYAKYGFTGENIFCDGEESCECVGDDVVILNTQNGRWWTCDGTEIIYYEDHEPLPESIETDLRNLQNYVRHPGQYDIYHWFRKLSVIEQ